MITTPRSKLISQQAYIQKVLRDRHRADSRIGQGVRDSVKEGGQLVYDFIRHSLVVVGILGLVGIAVGATTESPIYHQLLNWISSFFI